jgi:membrane protease YdiL (CAAX protease family)
LSDPAAQPDPSQRRSEAVAAVPPSSGEAGEVAPVAPATPVAAVQAIRFCRTCGAAWDPTWLECAQCARVRPAATGATAFAIEQAFRQDQREIKSAVSLYFALLAVSAVMMVALMVAEREATAGEELFAGAAMAAITTVWCLVASRRDVLPQLAQRVSPAWFPIAALVAIPTYALAAGAVAALRAGFEIPDLRYLDPFIDQGWGFAWAVVGICVMPGVFEELAFRGVIFGALQRVLGSTEALIVSALMFAILHLAVPSMPHLFVMGLALGWLRIRTGSLLPGMLTHFTHNLLVLLAERTNDGGFLPW